MSASSITLFNFLLHSLALGLLGWLVVRFGVRDARRRAHAALMAIILVLVAPWVVAEWPYPYRAPEAPVLTKIHQVLQAEWRIKVDAAPVSGPILPAASVKPAPKAWSLDDLASYLQMIWLMGFGLALARHLWQSWKTWCWRRKLRVPTPRQWRALPKSAPIHSIRIFDHQGSPCVVGLFDPVIAVPSEAFQKWDEQEWQWLLRHEGEHLRGGDVVITWFMGWARAFGWWNPFVHALIECGSHSREEVCDAVALGRTGEAEDYAEFLLEVAAGKQSCLAGAVPMVQSRPARRLRARLAALLAARPVRERLGWAYLLVSGVSYLLGYTFIASIGMTANAEERSAPLTQATQPAAPHAAPSSPAANALPGALHTWSFKVPPNFLSSGDRARQTAKELLIQKGITFPEGASAFFSAASSQLVVKNTDANLDLVEKVVADANAIEPQVYISSRLIEADQTFGVAGQVLKEIEVKKLLETIEGHAGARSLAAPSVTTRASQRAAVELLRPSPNEAEDKFTGIRIEIDSRPAEKGRILARIAPTLGLEDGQPLLLDGNGPSHGDWSKVHTFSTEAQREVATGETMVLHLSRDGRSFTLLVTLQALLPTGQFTTSFAKIKQVPSTMIHGNGDFESMAKAGAERDAALAAKKVYLTCKVVDIEQEKSNELGFDWLIGSDVQGGQAVFGGPTTSGNPPNGPTTGANNPTTSNVPVAEIPANSFTIPPGVYTIAGVFTDPQFQVVMRALSQKKGVNLIVVPSVSMQSGKETVFPMPKELETTRVNVTPVIGPDGYTIDLDISVGSVGDTKKVTTAVTVWDGQTVVMGTPLSAEEKHPRSRMVFITAKMIDPNGKPAPPKVPTADGPPTVAPETQAKQK